MRLLYYNIFVCKNGKKTDYPLEKVLDHVMRQSSKQRLKELRNGAYSINQMRFPDLERETRNRSFWVSKYRDKKPLTGVKGTDEAEPITKDVIETANCLLIPVKNLLVMEYAHLGCRINNLVEYLNTFLFNSQETAGDKWSISFEKIRKPSSIDEIKNSIDVKSLTVDFLVDSNMEDLLIANDSSAKTLMEKLIETSNETAKFVSGNIATFTIKKGKFKRKMDSLDVVKLLQVIQWEQEGIESIKVTFDNPVTGKKNDVVDLKHDGQIQDELLKGDTSNGFEYLAKSISDFYYGDGGRKAYSNVDKYNRENVNSNTDIFRENINEKNEEKSNI
ncbi:MULTISPECIES: hypothetical protein [Enterococcus]|uniref:hypothetical protein n=1 Tax=Enterococcus TaxID=1350 RepID=UPI0024937BDD|nr:hypothetical protein [Enterococcus dispar]